MIQASWQGQLKARRGNQAVVEPKLQWWDQCRQDSADKKPWKPNLNNNCWYKYEYCSNGINGTIKTSLPSGRYSCSDEIECLRMTCMAYITALLIHTVACCTHLLGIQCMWPEGDSHHCSLHRRQYSDMYDHPLGTLQSANNCTWKKL